MKKGFTLVELLIVFGVIAILIAVILAKINSTKNQARDSSIKETMATPLTKLSIEYYTNNLGGGYAAFCNDSETRDLFSKINSPNEDHPYCSDNDIKWAACVQLNSSSEKAWCVDSTGIRKKIDADECRQNTKSCP